MNTDTILRWAEKSNNIRALVLTGSRARGDCDELSDYDVVLFVKDTKPFVRSDRWLTKLGKAWVGIAEETSLRNRTFPTRLVIFDQGIKVDFTILPLDLAKEKTFEGEYLVLLDREGRFKKTRDAKAKTIKKPSSKEFWQLVDEFWFEAYHVAKYLNRGDLWQAKMREADLKYRILITMLAWNVGLKNGWAKPSIPVCKNVESWLDRRTSRVLTHLFSKYDRKKSQNALKKIIELFTVASEEISKRLKFTGRHEAHQELSKYINNLLHAK